MQALAKIDFAIFVLLMISSGIYDIIHIIKTHGW